MPCPSLDTPPIHHSRRIKIEEKAKVVVAVWGTELIKCLAALAIFRKDDFKNKIKRLTVTWRNGCFGKLDDHPDNTIPNQ